jgi:hypothetical protein
VRRRVIYFLAVSALVVGAGCRVDTEVAVTVDPDGGGTVAVTVTLDAEAAAEVPDLDQSLLVEDLEATGWRVRGPLPAPGGGARVVATRRFANPGQLDDVADQLTVDGGPIRDFRLTREHSFGTTRYRLEGTVDLSGGLDAFGDQALRDTLGGQMLGRSPEELAAELGVPPEEAFRFRVRVRLPDGEEAVWTPELGADPLTIEATSTRRRPQAWLFAGAAAVAALGFIVTLALVVRLNRRNPPPRR